MVTIADTGGFTPAELAAVGFNPLDPNAVLPTRMIVTKLQGKAGFNATGHDTWSLQATLPNAFTQPSGKVSSKQLAALMAAQFGGANLWAYCGGADISFGLNAKGQGAKSNLGAVRVKAAKKGAPNLIIQVKAANGALPRIGLAKALIRRKRRRK